MRTLEIRIFGIVQGVGFRPFVDRLAHECGILGSVANRGSFVEVFAQGGGENLSRFLSGLRTRAPERSLIMKIGTEERDMPPFGDFQIVESLKEKGDIFVSPDIGICRQCAAELRDPADRRYLHPFINCTNCGPRLTILDSMPYDRERTSMGEFPMCPDCLFEYTHPETRRYDAQPVCCNACGPEVYILGEDVRGREAITAARRAIMEGRIIAVKGIGGFHLCCDACNEPAVARLRVLKKRPAKPFAVMMPDLETIGRECAVGDAEKELLTGFEKPIVLLEKKAGSSRIAESVAPGNPRVGVMLPYAPLQMLLFDYPDGIAMTDVLVMTSGNASGAPICRTDADVIRELGGFCDMVLSHNRRIRLRGDDSVVGCIEGRPSMIRRSRGYAPLPQIVSGSWKGTVLGIGGELKNTFCVARNGLFYLSPHIGDMGDVRTMDALRESVDRLCSLLEMKPEAVACDMHPRYNSSLVAREMGLPLLEVQHHWAHILSCMAENDRTEPVLGVSFDGTGYGSDGTIWGGEFLVSSLSGFRRAASLKPFLQPGGDRSARQGWRIAGSMLRGLLGAEAPDAIRRFGLAGEKDSELLCAMVDKRINTVTSTSAGRLFDAVSAVLGLRLQSTFEGEASMALQFAAERAAGKREAGWDPSLLAEEQGRTVLRTDRLFERMVQGVRDGEDTAELAWEFHAVLAEMTARCCALLADQTGIRSCCLSGGVFQNRVFAELTARRIRELGLEVLMHRLVPPGDGGIALGQALAAAHAMREGRLP